jgi:hypothetical protein
MKALISILLFLGAAKPFEWGYFPSASLDGKNTYSNIGLHGGDGKFGLNIVCLERGKETPTIKAYIWVDSDPTRDQLIKVRWDNSPATNERWIVSGSSLAPAAAITFLKKLVAAKSLTLEYSSFGKAEHKTIVLPVSGAAAELHQYCREWK